MATKVQRPGRVVVTGGAGYLGSHVTRRLLDRGYEVCVLDAQLFGSGLSNMTHDRLEVIRGDVRNIADVSRAIRGAAAVIHLAAIVGDAACSVDPDVTWTTNVQATRILLEACAYYQVPRLLFASTCSVYGASDDLMLNEGSLCRPVSLYAESRIDSERLCLAANGTALAVTCLRMATLYGLSARMRFDLVVNIMSARAARDGVVTIFGGEQWRPLVHADDAAEAFALALEAPASAVAGQVFNVGTNPQNFKVSEVGQRIATRLRAALEVRPPSNDDRRNYRVSFDKIAHILGFASQRTIDSASSDIEEFLRHRPNLDYRDDRFQNHRFPYAIDPAVLPSHRPWLRSVDDLDAERTARIQS